MRVAVLGDEPTAIAWQLAATRVGVPGLEDAETTFRAALSESDLVLVTGPVAAALMPATLERARRAAQPLVLVIPDMLGRSLAEDLAQEIRRTLGVDT
jgi:vacuolar-type H+-ATPase subunit F/Vma7